MLLCDVFSCLYECSGCFSDWRCVYVCRLLTRIKRTCYTTENKIMKLQMNKKQYNTVMAGDS